MSKTVIIKEDKYYVEIDNYNHTLYKYDAGGYEVKVPKTKETKIKEPSLVFVGHYPNMKQCLSKCVELETLEGLDCTDIKTYLSLLKETIKDLEGGSLYD